MREIKFRGLIESQNEGMPNTPTDKWVYGSLVVEPERCIIQWVDGSLVVEPERCIIQWVDERNIVRAKIVVTDSVGQMTGLKDKNGVEIFEGDIVRHHTNSVGEVRFDKYIPDNQNEDILCWIVALPLRYRALDPQGTWGVIGNIYENPELLK